MTNAVTVSVLVSRYPEAIKSLKKLAKKAECYGCEPITFTTGNTWTKTYTVNDWDGIPRTVKSQMVELIIEGDAPKVGNFEFLAHVEIGKDANLVLVRPGAEIDEKYRRTDGYCDHCKQKRFRKDVYIVSNVETHEQCQVGRSCLRDFLGIDNPQKIANRFEFFNDIKNFEKSYSNSSLPEYSVEGLLTLTATVIRLFGWCSLSKVAENPMLTSTLHNVGLVIFGSHDDDQRTTRQAIITGASDEDSVLAKKTIEYFTNINPSSDYEHNIKTLCSLGALSDMRKLGLLISSVAAYYRATTPKKPKVEKVSTSVHVGQIGQRLRDLSLKLETQFRIGQNEWGEKILIKMSDPAGNIFTWVTGRRIEGSDGEQLIVTGTVKAHNQFNGVLETNLTRCSVSPQGE